MKTIPCLIKMAALPVLAGYASLVVAHDESGSLGVAAGTSDIYSVICTTGDTQNARLEVSVINVTKSSPLLIATIEKDGSSQTVTDPVSGDSGFSPKLSLTEGDGGYKMTLTKATSGSLKYAIQFHCKTAAGLHTGGDTSIQLVQDDAVVTPPPSNFTFQQTEIKDEVLESEEVYTGVAIGQGCEDDYKTAKPLPVVAQRVVFPNGLGSEAYRIETDGSETAIVLSAYIDQANGGVVTLGPSAIQDKSIFKKNYQIYDTNGRVRAIEARNGKLDANAMGIVPFHATAPAFKAGNCAKRLLIRIAVANYCSKTRNTNKDNRSDIWIDHLTPLFNDPGVLPHDYEASPYWPTLVVNRNLDANPLASGCGEGFDIAVQPSDAEIDAYLPMSGFWPR